MLIHCYRSWSQDQRLLDRLWWYVDSHQGWMSPKVGAIDFWIPEQYSSFLILISPELQRRFELDMID